MPKINKLLYFTLLRTLPPFTKGRNLPNSLLGRYQRVNKIVKFKEEVTKIVIFSVCQRKMNLKKA